MNKFIIRLFRQLEARNVSYCHFKSNNNLEAALSGVDDLDLLIAPKNVDTFMEIIASFGYRTAMDRNSAPTPFVYHFFGADPDTGLLVHLHVYFRLITGGSILKNHWIRVEDMFLEQVGANGEAKVFIPSANADLILFTIRKFIEQPSLIEHFLFLRDAKNILAELKWLMARADREEMRELVAKWIHNLPVSLFDECLDALIEGSTIWQRVCLGRKMCQCFTQTVYHPLFASLRRTKLFITAFVKGKMSFTRKERFVFPGGMLIAFVGSEASGKSTMSNQITNWLDERFDTVLIHTGKPKKNWRTLPFWVGIKIFSALKRTLRSPVSHQDSTNTRKSNDVIANNLPNPVICWLDSIDRLYWIKKFSRQMLQGRTVITDRYPALNAKGLDGARIESNSTLTALLAKWEVKNYSKLPHPDLVLKMLAPLKTTLARNSEREIPEPESFVRNRYALAKKIDFPLSVMAKLDTTKSIEETRLLAQKLIWNWGLKK